VRILVVANDFPPKLGGIQSYHRELWSRFPPEEIAVLTLDHPDAAAFDAAQGYAVHRERARVLLPTAALARRIRALVAEHRADLVVFDPELPVGWLAPRLGLPYAVIIHGGVIVRARLPVVRGRLATVLRGASLVISAGDFPALQARRVVGDSLPPVVTIPPGVDAVRFHPLSTAERNAVRDQWGIPGDARLVLSVSRLAPRKGMDVLIEAASLLGPGRPDLVVAIGGAGGDRQRLERRAERFDTPVRFLGRVPDADLPGLYGAADAFVMLCRDAGLVKEGFGVVFAEAAAAGVPAVAGESGGAADAVVDAITGSVVRDPRDPVEAAAAIARLLDDPELRARQGRAGRERVERELTFDTLATRLREALRGVVR
jgi:phosphatidylinositol alpha-1,6-mannosyltransferase